MKPLPCVDKCESKSESIFNFVVKHSEEFWTVPVPYSVTFTQVILFTPPNHVLIILVVTIVVSCWFILDCGHNSTTWFQQFSMVTRTTKQEQGHNIIQREQLLFDEPSTAWKWIIDILVTNAFSIHGEHFIMTEEHNFCQMNLVPTIPIIPMNLGDIISQNQWWMILITISTISMREEFLISTVT